MPGGTSPQDKSTGGCLGKQPRRAPKRNGGRNNLARADFKENKTQRTPPADSNQPTNPEQDFKYHNAEERLYLQHNAKERFNRKTYILCFDCIKLTKQSTDGNTLFRLYQTDQTNNKTTKSNISSQDTEERATNTQTKGRRTCARHSNPNETSPEGVGRRADEHIVHSRHRARTHRQKGRRTHRAR